MSKGVDMKQEKAIVASARIALGCLSFVDEPTEALAFLGLHSRKFAETRVYEYAMDGVDRLTIEGFEKCFRSVVSEDVKLRKELRRYRELDVAPILLLGLSLEEFSGRNVELASVLAREDRIASLARNGSSIEVSFSNDSSGQAAKIEIPSTLVKFLAKHRFSLRLSLG